MTSTAASRRSLFLGRFLRCKPSSGVERCVALRPSLLVSVVLVCACVCLVPVSRQGRTLHYWPVCAFTASSHFFLFSPSSPPLSSISGQAPLRPSSHPRGSLKGLPVCSYLPNPLAIGLSVQAIASLSHRGPAQPRPSSLRPHSFAGSARSRGLLNLASTHHRILSAHRILIGTPVGTTWR